MNLASNGAENLRLFISGMAPAFYEDADGTILMNAIGNDIWDAADQFRFAYKQLSGDGSMIARVDDLDASPNQWVKAGVMIRQDTAVGSVHSFMPMTGGGGNGASWQGRLTANANSENTDATEAVAPPYWVRIDRAGDALTGFISPDGETWTQLGDPRTIAMTDPVLIGLALTSHNVNQATSASFSNVSITGASGAWEIAEIGATQPVGNDPLPIYVALGNAVVVNSDVAATARSGWTEWVIPLSEFGNVGNVSSMTIGVGDPSNGGSGSGLVFIDDVGYGRAYIAPADPNGP
jgi:regulation of enolase protein 1 (concanavalin A-like superfamily)